MKHEPLPAAFYENDTVAVAQELLGHFLLRRLDGQWCGGEIVETEAYLADDPACHAYLRETPRNRTMWGRPGRAYVYRIYGAHFCFNAVCREAGVAEAVLIRALEPRFGVELMLARRPVEPKGLGSGPAKLCQALDITLELDGAAIDHIESPLIIASNADREQFCAARSPLVTAPRIGVTKAADWPYRWYLDGSAHVSRRIARSRAIGPGKPRAQNSP